MKTLDCLYCHKEFEINKMFTVDACCESHQKMLEALEFWGERPEIIMLNFLYRVEHDSKFGTFHLKGIYHSFEDALYSWNKFVKEQK